MAGKVEHLGWNNKVNVVKNNNFGQGCEKSAGLMVGWMDRTRV